MSGYSVSLCELLSVIMVEEAGGEGRGGEGGERSFANCGVAYY